MLGAASWQKILSASLSLSSLLLMAEAPSSRPSASRFQTLVSSGTTWRRDKDSTRSEEHTSELQSLMRISYAVFCLQKKKNLHTHTKQKHNYRTSAQTLHTHNDIYN